jgi:hypothetical protein
VRINIDPKSDCCVVPLVALVDRLDARDVFASRRLVLGG